MTKRARAEEPNSPAGLALDRARSIEIYSWLVVARTFEERLLSLSGAGVIPGSAKVGYGRETVCVPAACALRQGDLFAPMVACPGAMLARGADAAEILALAMGRSWGRRRGREADAPYGDLERGILAATAMPGTLMPVVAGAALGARMLRRPLVALTILDEIQTNSTDFHEGFNLAAVRKAAVVVVVLVNDGSLRTPTEKQTAHPDFADRARAYGVAGFEADGLEPLAVHEACLRAASHARSGAGPVLVGVRVAKGAPPAPGRDRDSAAGGAPPGPRRPDPIRRLAQELARLGWLDGPGRQEIAHRALEALDRATAEARQAPLPPASEALSSVYHDPA